MNTTFQRFGSIRALFVAALGLTAATSCLATSTDGYHKAMVVPVVVTSNTYNSTIYIHNPSTSTSISVHPTFYQGVSYAGVDPSAVTPVDCPVQAIAAGVSKSFATLADLCPAAPAPVSSSIFGWLRVQEVTPSSTLTFAVFTRIDNVQRTNGFEVEGYPAQTFTGADAYVIGLSRTGSGTILKANCFVSALNEPTTVNLALLNGATGSTLSGPITINLPANRMARLLDIFGSAIGDYSNAILKVTTTPGSGVGGVPVYPGVIAFCTSENNQSRDDDFRIAKTSPVFDGHVQRLWLENSDELAQVFSVDNAHSNRHILYLKHPDVVECSLGGTGASSLELRLFSPELVQVAGGPSVTSFADVYTGDKGAHGEPGTVFGANGKWELVVQPRSGAAVGTYQYILACRAGSGFGGHEWVGRNQPIIP